MSLKLDAFQSDHVKKYANIQQLLHLAFAEYQRDQETYTPHIEWLCVTWHVRYLCLSLFVACQ